MIYDPTLAFLYRRHSASDSSVRALDGRRFDEEARFFGGEADAFAARGWKSAERAARLHVTSRLNALSLLPISERITVLRHLPYPLRDAMKPLCIGGSQRLHMQPWSPAVLAMRHA